MHKLILHIIAYFTIWGINVHVTYNNVGYFIVFRKKYTEQLFFILCLFLHDRDDGSCI